MATKQTKNDPDYRFHQESYDNVTTVIKVSIVLIIVTLAGLAAFVV